MLSYGFRDGGKLLAVIVVMTIIVVIQQTKVDSTTQVLENRLIVPVCKDLECVVLNISY